MPNDRLSDCWYVCIYIIHPLQVLFTFSPLILQATFEFLEPWQVIYWSKICLKYNQFQAPSKTQKPRRLKIKATFIQFGFPNKRSLRWCAACELWPDEETKWVRFHRSLTVLDQATRPRREILADRKEWRMKTIGFGHEWRSSWISPSFPPKSRRSMRTPSSADIFSFSKG